MAGSRGRSSLWTREQAANARKLSKRGLPVTKIADEIGLTRSTTRRILQRAGLVSGPKGETQDRYVEQLSALLPLLAAGTPLEAACTCVGISVAQGRHLIRGSKELCWEPLSKGEAQLVARLTKHLRSAGVKEAAVAEGVEPWWALAVLLRADVTVTSMLPSRDPAQHARIKFMIMRRTQGATLEQIAAEVGLGRERTRRLLNGIPRGKPGRPPAI